MVLDKLDLSGININVSGLTQILNRYHPKEIIIGPSNTNIEFCLDIKFFFKHIGCLSNKYLRFSHLNEYYSCSRLKSIKIYDLAINATEIIKYVKNSINLKELKLVNCDSIDEGRKFEGLADVY